MHEYWTTEFILIDIWLLCSFCFHNHILFIFHLCIIWILSSFLVVCLFVFHLIVFFSFLCIVYALTCTHCIFCSMNAYYFMIFFNISRNVYYLKSAFQLYPVYLQCMETLLFIKFFPWLPEGPMSTKWGVCSYYV